MVTVVYKSKRKVRKAFKKAKARARPKLSLSQVTNIRRQTPLSNKFKFTTRYVETYINLNPGVAGIAAQYFFRCNSLNDPNATGGGHRVIGFDQIMAMYNHYTVIGSKIKVTFANTDGTHQALVGISLTDDQIASTNLVNLVENGNSTYRLLAPSQGDPKSIGILTKGFSANKYFGKKVMQGTEFSALRESNPAEMAYFMLWAAPITQDDIVNIKILVQIEYTAILTEPRELAQSN